MEFASSSSPFSKSKPQFMYDVFINFRGEDTRKKFVCHIYKALSNAGINTFIDEENIQKGMTLDELMTAIEGSQIAIVVFSKTYTESTWCLRELQKIIECHENYGQRVVPVFYHIDPSHIRHQEGDFGSALNAVAERRHSGEDLKSALSNWKRVLKKATDFSGWNERDFRNDAELVKEIVNDVLTKLEYEVLPITRFPVGLESQVQEVIRFIETTTYSCIIGIWGMGGSGKTTTAKAIYNQIHRSFMDKSFIEDIREACKRDRGQIRLQKQLLSDVLKTKVEIHSIGRGTTVIENRLSKKRLLIVLDDVNKSGQLKALCGNLQWIGEGSVIIITTRDKHLFTGLKVDYVHEMKEMHANESLELLSWHAFREAKPKEDFNELARNVVAYCGGLPLALEDLGLYLTNRTTNEWRSALSKLETTPNPHVQEILKISFDGLNDEKEKDIFLDVCCFFIGKDIAYVTEILNGCGLHSDCGIPVLIDRSLIKVEKNNKLGMHNLVQEMGREIIRQSSRKKPGKRSRLWFNVEVVDVLTKNTGTEVVEGLALKFHVNSRNCFKTCAFEKMQRLRLLQLENIQLAGDYGYLSKELRWMCWQGFPSKYIPKNFNMENVIAIDLKRSNLRLVWKEPQDLASLKILNLSHSKYLTETPDFSKLRNLEKLILKDCPRLCKNNAFGDVAPMLGGLGILRSVLVQCDTELQLLKLVRTIVDYIYDVYFTDLEITSYASRISKHSLSSWLIGIGSYQEVFQILSKSIHEGLAINDSCDAFLPGDNDPHWLVRMGEGNSVYFTVPENCRMKGMALCVVYLTNPKNTAAECLIYVLMVNYTKCSIKIYKQDTVISFNDVDWQGIISHLEPGDKVKIFVTFGHGFVVKKTAVYLIRTLGEPSGPLTSSKRTLKCWSHYPHHSCS
ncbi:hypothetical protein GLYMA_03G088000v4 [Glycine max]|uniref:TIR domain-containing protein n=1 Tax=Glycine max TaxID=3847 RepID=K7KDW3_SOYBN|nr:disease resistance protein RUN1 isoform X2 [Glycine max]KAH1069166.1 hypothetical protein GYH30_006671 [Glycine max]KAH1257342.1 TMV resistance protein N [Glycine max]KRH66174.1 hypothetical protein GLYMA_03G088000v4 [Glycine max]|eukprot:XP_006576646.1 TMV resistance protein N isoform X3 [Glycine max]